MTTSAYLTGRRRYARPQSILWANNPGYLSNGLYVPNGIEVGANTEETDINLLDQFVILSDHNRGDMQFNTQRIEQRQRTINGRMRSFHIADKLSMSVSWNLLPSRGYSELADFNESTGLSPDKGTTSEYTADGGAGGVELLEWYENHQGPFWMYLAYDKYTNLDGQDYKYNGLNRYNQIIQVYFSDFNYSVVKRGATNHDLWNISVTLEEV
jgi:hypothetical protein